MNDYEDLLKHCKTDRQTELIFHLAKHSNKSKTIKECSTNKDNLNRLIRSLRQKKQLSKIVITDNKDIIVIADTQVAIDSPTSHLYALSRYIWEHKPSYIVHIGDHWDFPSLSSYASKAAIEGRRLADDLGGGFDAFKLIMMHVDKMNEKLGMGYKPEKVFLMGNHENRLFRYINDNPILHGCFDLEGFIKDQGWKVKSMNDPHWIFDICFSHFMENAMSGKAVGGSIENKLNKFPHSFIHGHQQQYQYGRRQNLLGKPHFGVCAGSFYMHDEDYRGANNTEIRGFTHLRGFTNRHGYTDHDVEFVSLERLLETFN